jgi:hypothetical protein
MEAEPFECKDKDDRDAWLTAGTVAREIRRERCPFPRSADGT